VAVAAGELVGALSIDAVHELHAAREVRVRRVDDEVVVRPHQHVRPANPVEASDDTRDEVEKEHAEVIVREEVALV
jgi:hypothetical protein